MPWAVKLVILACLCKVSIPSEVEVNHHTPSESARYLQEKEGLTCKNKQRYDILPDPATPPFNGKIGK